jgi:hypothetical protein
VVGDGGGVRVAVLVVVWCVCVVLGRRARVCCVVMLQALILFEKKKLENEIRSRIMTIN